MTAPSEAGFVLPNYPAYPQPAYPNPQQQAPPYQAQQVPYPPPQVPYAPAAGYQHQPFPAPIQHQPGFGSSPQAGVQWFANNNFQHYLRDATSFHVKQKVELLEAFVGWETPNKYTVKDQAGNKVFYVGEESDLCLRQCFGRNRPFTLQVKDAQGSNILTFDRSLSCTCCFGMCCSDSLTVSAPNGQVLGTVVEECNILFPMFSLKDAAGNTLLKIEGPLCPMTFGCAQGAVFRVLTPNGVSVGTISKEWSGLVRELFTDADYFSMSFPRDLDISMKAVCLGALFLIVSFSAFVYTSYMINTTSLPGDETNFVPILFAGIRVL